jgi:hypothetical protein
VKTHSFLSALVLALALIVGCSDAGGGDQDPSAVYEKLVQAAAKKDYGYLYDRLDAKMRENVDNLIKLSFQTKDSMAPAERAFWDSVGRKSPRDAFISIMASDPTMTANLSSDYKVLAADTMVVLTIQRTGRAPELRYFQVERGELRVSDPPAPPMSEMPIQDPGVFDAPGGTPQGAPPNGSGAPNDAVHGGTGGDAPPGGTDTGR